MKSVTYNRKIHVHFSDDLDGGGQRFGQDFIGVVAAHRKKHRTDSIFEFCAGPGFIGFSLLSHGLCRRLCVADVHKKAVDCCQFTVKENRLEGEVSVYLSDCLDGIPPSEKWDLVVSNPPHFAGLIQKLGTSDDQMRMYRDADWNLHRRFYATVKPHLAEGGYIIMQENGFGSHVDNFRPMIEANGLKIVGVAFSREHPNYYYIWITHA